MKKLIAVQFTRFMTSGRTSPALCTCENEFGEACGEYVIKLGGSIQLSGLLNELIGNLLASHFSLSCPKPAIVMLENDLANLIASVDLSKEFLIKRSVGLNYGSQAVLGFSTWPVDKTIPEAMWQSAIEIFAFDALLQNPDRRHNNPNLLINGDAIMIYDHELAFSFTKVISPSATPWRLESQKYLTEHVFYRQLKSKAIDLNAFTSRLRNLSRSVIQTILAEAPEEWSTDFGMKIVDHLSLMSIHADEFAEELRRFLV